MFLVSKRMLFNQQDSERMCTIRLPILGLVIVGCVLGHAVCRQEERHPDLVPSSRPERSFGNDKEEPPSRPNSHLTSGDGYNQPYFGNNTDRNVTVQLGKTAYLNCKINQLGDRTVSWVRQHDLHILTVGSYTYTSDQRFKSLHLEGTTDWTLKIQYTKKHDSGIYECQISTEPKLSLNYTLNVVVAKAVIIEGEKLYIQSGSIINLTCVITDNKDPPIYVFWYHNGKMINYETDKGIEVVTDKGPTTVSKLRIENAKSSNSGNYSCSPSYSEPANITVHVLDGDKPAAMHHGQHTSQGSIITCNVVLLLITWFLAHTLCLETSYNLRGVWNQPS
ncbi:neurotrimin-like [Tachypleus tridentatus]|uniref:neurotrimin-like n=1 Tax=Tachypleus tridentatus TaxID=6853 RepID=UPI003FD53421